MTAQFDATLCDEVNWRALCSASNFKAYFQNLYMPYEFRAVTLSLRVVHKVIYSANTSTWKLIYFIIICNRRYTLMRRATKSYALLVVHCVEKICF